MTEPEDKPLDDHAILNCLEMLLSEQSVPIDFVFGRFAMVLRPNQPLRPQLQAALKPHVTRLIAEKLAGKG